jgi:hypothetical protein
MMRNLVLVSVGLLVVSTCLADVLTLDSLPDTPGMFLCTGGIVPNGYGGLNWNNFGYLNAAVFPCSTESGYGTALTSSPNVGFNILGNPASITSATPFTLESAYFAAAWNDGLTVSITAKSGANTVAMLNLTLNTEMKMFETFDFGPITELDFSSFGGIPQPLRGMGTEFAFDSLTVNTVPEPRMVLVLSMVLGALALMRPKLFV